MSEYLDIDKEDIKDADGNITFFYIFSTAKYSCAKPYYVHYYRENSYPSNTFMLLETGEMRRVLPRSQGLGWVFFR